VLGVVRWQGMSLHLWWAFVAAVGGVGKVGGVIGGSGSGDVEGR
jgi:hypothetical protein